MHKNQTNHQNHLKFFLYDRGDQSFKSEESLGHNSSPTLNKIAKTKRGSNKVNIYCGSTVKKTVN